MTFHASAVINLHREGLLAKPSFNSLFAARDAAAKAGFQVEFIAVADRADALTQALLDGLAPQLDQIHAVDFGDLGASRAFGIQQASCDWVFMHDADDLFSTNWYLAFLERLARNEVDPRTVYHTDLFARFGVETDIRKMIDSNDARFHPLMLASEWYFSNKAVLHRDLLDEIPMPHNNLHSGIGNEDWTWSSHSLVAGIRHEPLPKTICFYRTKSVADSLGLTPGMIHDASPLYDTENIFAQAVERDSQSRRPRGFAPALVAKGDPVIGEGSLPDWFWAEVDAQGVHESQITDFSTRRSQIQSYFTGLNYNVVSAVEYLMKDMDTRPKIFLFASTSQLQGADNIIDLFLRAAAQHDSKSYQPVLIIDEGSLVPSDMRLLVSYGAKVIAIDHLRSYYRCEDWYFRRLLMRPLIQFKGSILLDLCSHTCAELFAQFHRVLIENFAIYRPVLLDRQPDIMSAGFRNLSKNARRFAQHSKAALPVLCRPELLDFLNRSTHLAAVALDDEAIEAIEQVTTLRYRQSESAPVPLLLAPLLDDQPHVPSVTVSVANVIYEPHRINGKTYHYYRSSHAWVPETWLPEALRFMRGNAHLSICAPQVTLSRLPDGRPHPRWHNYSEAANNFAATYEQVLAGQHVPVLALLCEPLSLSDTESPRALAAALADFAQGRLASAFGESLAVHNDPALSRKIALPPPQDDRDIYWQCYEDLMAMFARGYWTLDQLDTHYNEHGIAGGRKIPEFSARPALWSDQLYFDTVDDSFKWWWDKGVLRTAAWRAMNEPNVHLKHGAIPENAFVQKRSAMHPGTLAILGEHDVKNPAQAVIPVIAEAPLIWAELRPNGLYSMIKSAKDLRKNGTTDVILVPVLESGGAELVALWHYRAAIAAGRKPVLILTDEEALTPRFAAENLTIINIPQIVTAQSGRDYGSFSVLQRAGFVTAVIEALTPRTLHLIHAFAAYQALKNRELASRLRAACGQIYVSAFCPHIHADGRIDGYFRDIPVIAPYVDRFIFDNHWFADQMRASYALSDAKIATIAYPVEKILPVPRSAKPGKHVLWASRLDAQKNPQIVATIARGMPDTMFHIYGRSVIGDNEVDWQKMPSNVLQCGPFFNIDELPLADMDAFLYTARFDGMPNILLEIAARGLPIITAPVGGVPDFFGENWALYALYPEDVAGFQQALDLVLNDAGLRADIIDTQLELLRKDRSVDVFYQRAAQFHS